MWNSGMSRPHPKRDRKKVKSQPGAKVCFLTPHRDALRYFGGIESESDSEAEERGRRQKQSYSYRQDGEEDDYPREIVIHHRLDAPTKKVKTKGKKKESLPPIKKLSGEVHILEVIKLMKDDKTNYLLYLNYALPIQHNNYSPFAFRVVSFWDVNKDKFLTVSNQGVIIGGGVQPTFYSLDEWEKQYEDWCKLMEFKSFKYFQLYKYLDLWYEKVCRKRYVRRKSALESRLIYTRPELREALMRVRTICCALSELSLFTEEKLNKLSLQQFLKMQSVHWNSTLKTFLDKQEVIRQALKRSAYSDCFDLGFKPEEPVNKSSPENSTRRGSSVISGKIKSPKNSLYTMSYTEALNRKNECKKITSMLRAADYQILFALINLLHNSITTFLKALSAQLEFLPHESILSVDGPLDEIIEEPRTSAPKNPLFLVDLLLGEENLDFEPCCKAWELAFVYITESWEEVASKVKPLQGEDIFKPFTHPIIAGFQEDRLCGYGPKIKDTIKHDEDYKNDVSDLAVLLKKNLTFLESYVQRFNAIRDKTICNLQLDKRTITEQTGLEVFKNMIVSYNKDTKLMESICSGQMIGAFFLNLESFKNESAPLVDKLRDLVLQTLKRLGMERVGIAFTDVIGALEYLGTEPTSSVHFVEYLAYIDSLVPRMEEIGAELDYLDELYALMDDFKVDLLPTDIKRHKDVGFKFCDLQDALEKAIASKPDIIAHFNEIIAIDFEVLMDEVMAINSKATESWLIDSSSDKLEALKTLTDYGNQLQKLLERFEQYNNNQRQVKVPVTRLDTLLDVINQVKIRKLMWESVNNWQKTLDDWMTCDFEDLDAEKMQQEIAVYAKNITSIIKNIGSNAIVDELKADLDQMISKLPVITTLRNPNLKQRHWQRIEELIGYKFDPGKIISLTLFDELNVYKYDVELAEISGQASSEASLEALLKKVEDAWKSFEFVVIPYKDSKDVFLLAGMEELQTVLDETNINLTTITSSRNVGPIKSRVTEWIKNIDLFSKTLDEWTKCQTNWLYLEPIFSAPDIQRQLPTEAKLFFIVDKSWKEIMKSVSKNPLALKFTIAPGLYEAFLKNNEYLEQILKCLEAYLESKRVVFPRFYFLSNEELLEILAQTKNPHAVQPHLRKCFDAIDKLEFGVRKVLGDEKNETVPTNDIKAMLSPEGEVVPLGKGLKARGNVEEWLGQVEASMFNTLWVLMKACIRDYLVKPRTEWVLNHASQLILTVSQIMWARDVHAVLTDKTSVADALLIQEQKSFNDLNDLAGMVRGELTKLQRNVLGALITIDVHARDIISSLIQHNVGQPSDFEWVKQLRYYWERRIDNCVAYMATARHIYGYEYLGASGRLVITPLTDKCYLCLMGALQLDLGGAPAGPAGTGKTETTKDLAKSLAIQCVVFNCSDGIDYKMMGRFFSGLAQSGAWCCFDEFNRIDIEVLSVIAQQLITIRNAKVAKVKRFMFEGREIKLVASCAAFITMNPGYAGRTELPDNLKSVFRPMAMMVPDYRLIAEVILYSEGFETSKVLARKMVNMYKLCSEQLSHQDHYDFGMRAVKSVLVMAGSLKRQNPDKNEEVVLIRALRDSNLPKFLAEDVILFGGILSDLFPGVVLPPYDYGEFQKTIQNVLRDLKLQPTPVTFTKVIQLYETMVVRWGVMTVGPTGGGKTTILNVLKHTLTRLHANGVKDPQFKPVVTYTLNPKSVTMGELYGEVNMQTMEWRDGLLGMFVRTAVNWPDDRHQWVICDGPVDAVWIENMNSVLDDNKLLCLANSERIKLSPWVHMIFEVEDLAQASPATVSRCGMVYVDPQQLLWTPYVTSWAQNFKTKEHFSDFLYNSLISLFEEHVDRGLDFIRKNCSVGMHQVDLSKITMMCSLIEYIVIRKKSPTKYMDQGLAVRMFSQVFMFSFAWSLGGNILDEGREAFDHHCKDAFKSLLTEVKFDTSKSVWDFFYDVEEAKFKLWNDIVKPFTYRPEEQYFSIVVPTIDTIRFGSLMTYLIEVNHPVLLTGQTGVGKSVTAKEVLDNLYKTGSWVPTTLNFSAQTSSTRTQEMIEAKLERKKKTVLGAPMGKRVVIFVDDVNMPKLEIYGAQPPVELLRQFLDFGGLYDREKLFWKELQNVVLCAGCAPPGGGRNPLTPRFTRHFAMLYVPSPSELALRVIFKSIISGFFANFMGSIQKLCNGLVEAAINVYKQLSRDLLPTPAKSHYVFNLRDLSKCVQGILQANADTMNDPKNMLRLFYHENLRVYHDRLIDVHDKSYFYHLLSNTCYNVFLDHVIQLPAKGLIDPPPLLLFGDFLAQQPKSNRIYEEITNLNKLRNVLQDFLEDYNLLRGRNARLIFFLDALEHICRLARILRNERGNGLLVGVGGMGKQSLTRLSSHINDCRDFQIEIKRNYDYSTFHEDLRKIYFNAGAKYEDSVFLFSDTQIVQEEFLEDVNNILNSGEVPNLFEADEYEKVIIACRAPMKQAGFNETNRDAIYDFFIARVKSKLHLVICMSPVGEAFRRRCRMFPSLVNCCTIDWFTTWPEEALLSVAQSTLSEFIHPNRVDNFATVCNIMHSTVESATNRFYTETKRHYYVTPSSYLDLLKLFRSVLKNKSDEIANQKIRISNGLKKLFETNDLVAVMQKQLITMEPVLAEKSKATEELMISVAKEKAAADEVKQVVLVDESTAKEIAGECQALADDAQKDLNLALPAMDAAVKALEALNKNDINEVRVFIKPPHLVKYTLEAVCLLLGAKQDWNSAKVVLGDGNFLKKLQDYEKNNISDVMLKKLKPFIDNTDFTPDIVATQSKACKSLCMWVRAIDTYAKVYRVVEPKRKKVEAAEKELNSVMSVLRSKQQRLANIEAQIAKLEARYDQSLQEKSNLEATKQLCTARLNRADRLTSALSDEQVRWQQLVLDMEEELTNIEGDALIAAGSIAYLGPFTSDFRDDLRRNWLSTVKELGIAASKTFSLTQLLTNSYEVREWNRFSLPRDQVSIENGIFVTKTNRWPLMIDPQEQASRWIRQMEADNNLKTIKMTDASFMRQLESSIKLGLPVLIHEVGEMLDPSLTPILLKQTFVAGGRTLIKLGDSDVEYDPKFKLYITTKMPNPHYLPEVCIQVTIVNFTVTPSGLEDQLLVDVVSHEKPELEEQRNELIVSINKDKAQLLAIEDKILKLLFSSQGNILDDEELVETLNESKETSAIISSRLAEAEETEDKISIARNVYKSVATRGSCLYFVVAMLGDIDPMYQFSLKYFKMVFNTVIKNAQAVPTVEDRIKQLLDGITLSVYRNVSRGLFEKDKLAFSFMLCISILIQAGEVLEDEWEFLIRGATLSSQELPRKPDGLHITDQSWQNICYLELKKPDFAGLTKVLNRKVFVSVGDYSLEISFVPNPQPSSVKWDEKLNLFQKMMLVKALKEEKVIFTISQFVKVNMGVEFIEAPIVNLQALYQDTNKVIPLIFILSPGSDVFSSFLRFASEAGNSDKVHFISLGQGQGPIARRMIERGQVKGDWIFLQNCHLATSWMLALESIVITAADNPTDVNDNFRLFLSSMPSKNFPVSVLQNAVKVTNEPPKGLRANIKKAFLDMKDQFFNDHPLDSKWRKMVFGLCVFHAIVLERKKFGPLGWNIAYEFSESDRECALMNLELYCQGGRRGIPWEALIYITGEITYGGRVTDYWDQRTLKTILVQFFSPQTLEDGYSYSASGLYHCPESSSCKNLVQYRKFIESLPLLEEPEIFGMHENANIALQTKETAALLRTIMSVQPQKSGKAEGKSSDDVVLEISDEISDKLAAKIETGRMKETMARRDSKGRLPSLSTILLQEVVRFNKLLSAVHSSLSDLKKAVKGLVVMSDALEGVYKAFLNNSVPAIWSKKSYPSLKSLGSWTRDLELRIDFIDVWMQQGPPPSFWLSGLFFPQGFMTGVLQTHARKYNLPIDRLEIDFRVLPITPSQEQIYTSHREHGKEVPEAYKGLKPSEDGVLIHGLFLEASRFDCDKMQLSDPKPGEVNPPLPALELVPVTSTPSTEGRYPSPLYKTSLRAGVLSTTGHSTNYVITVLLPTDQAPSYWIMKGTALLTQVTD